MLTWVSRAGVVLPDLVPAALRQSWVRQGFCPDTDLFALFHAAVAADPDRPAVVDPDGSCCYAELHELALRWAGTLASAGLGAGDIIGTQLPNGRQAIASELAMAALGAVALPFPADRGELDTRRLLTRSRAAAHLVADQATCATDRCPVLRPAMVTGPPLAALPSPPDSGAPARMLVSSGSEAEPKMVAYSHQAMAGGRRNYLRAVHGPGPMRTLVLVPLSSSFGSLGLLTLLDGGTLVLWPGFDPATALRLITEHRPTGLFAVPTMLGRLVDRPPEPGERLGSLRVVVSSGAALPPAIAQACARRFGVAPTNVYGSADGVNCHTARTGPVPPGCVGRPDPAVALIGIMDPAGQPVPPDQPGEICALGPMTPLCYVGAPELDARYRLPGGWVRTGDLGRLDETGRLHVLARIKQVIIRGGDNISPAELEQQLAGHPAVADVACVPVPDPALGERVCACVAFRAAPLSLAELNQFLATECGVSRRKLPERLLVLPELPLGPTGKVCRSTLTRLAGQEAAC